MTPITARNLSAVVFVALLLPCKNLLLWLDSLCFSLGAPPLLENLILAAIRVFGPKAVLWVQILPMLLLAFLLSLALYRYLRRRDFPQLCADCAARKPLVWTLFLLFAFLSLLHPYLFFITATPPPVDTSYFDENFEGSPDDAFADPEDAPPPAPTPPPHPLSTNN